MNALSAWRKWATALRLDVLTLYHACRNPRTPWYAKVWAIIVVSYALSPVDLIPDFIPILGSLDDLVLVPLGLALAIKLIPRDVLEESRVIAATRARSRGPANWIAGGIIIGAWIAFLAYILCRVVRAFGRW